MPKIALNAFRVRGRRRSQKIAWSLVSLVLAILGACIGGRHTTTAPRSSDVGHAANWSGTVTHVTDGDTLRVAPAAGGAPRTIRIDGIDAPESCQRFGPAARDALSARVLRRRVDVATRGLDIYRRELARLTIDGSDVGAWMVAQGNAWSYRYQRDRGPYASQEREARRAARGLFADPNPQPPRDFRKSHGPCR